MLAAEVENFAEKEEEGSPNLAMPALRLLLAADKWRHGEEEESNLEEKEGETSSILIPPPGFLPTHTAKDLLANRDIILIFSDSHKNIGPRFEKNVVLQCFDQTFAKAAVDIV